jgi:chromosome segregation ATPase
MNQHIQTLQRFNAWRRGDDVIEQPEPRAIGQAIDAVLDHISELDKDRDDWKTEAEIWKNECKILRIELKKADGAHEENVITFLELRAEIESLRDQLGIAKKDWLN